MLVGLDISAGATLGILGYGRIGEAVAAAPRPSTCPSSPPHAARTPGTVENGVTFVDTPTLLADSDVISVHTPLTPEPTTSSTPRPCAP